VTATGVNGVPPDSARVAEDFENFVAGRGADLRRALTARYGVDVGAEVTADVLALAWERWASISVMENPVGYLFRAGQTAARRYRDRPLNMTFVPAQQPPEFEPQLPRLLERLAERQRTAIVLVCIYDWTYSAAAEVMGISESSARAHVQRGLANLRHALEGEAK
jgi:DNA-directed RNA polymerase specialized sigma24 family protein